MEGGAPEQESILSAGKAFQDPNICRALVNALTLDSQAFWPLPYTVATMHGDIDRETYDNRVILNSLVCVSKTMSEPALDALWENLFAFLPLARLLFLENEKDLEAQKFDTRVLDTITVSVMWTLNVIQC